MWGGNNCQLRGYFSLLLESFATGFLPLKISRIYPDIYPNVERK